MLSFAFDNKYSHNKKPTPYKKIPKIIKGSLIIFSKITIILANCKSIPVNFFKANPLKINWLNAADKTVIINKKGNFITEKIVAKKNKIIYNL